MNFYKNNNTRFEDEETPDNLPENPMEKMMSSWQFDKKFIEQRKVFLWGVVDDKSAKELEEAGIIVLDDEYILTTDLGIQPWENTYLA